MKTHDLCELLKDMPNLDIGVWVNKKGCTGSDFTKDVYMEDVCERDMVLVLGARVDRDLVFKRIDRGGGGMSELVRREYITCPNCKAVSLAAVTHDAWMPFDNYHHECNCGYLIGESEWDVVRDKEAAV